MIPRSSIFTPPAGLEDIAEASPAEQIAYLLVERARLFDELAALEEEGVPGVVITPAGPLTAEELHAVLLRERAEWEEERQEMQRGKLSLSDERKEARIVALEREVEKLGKQVVEVKRENECLRLERDSLMEKGIEEREKVQAKMEEMLLIERRETDILKSDKEEMQVALADAEDRISGLEKQRDDSDMLLRKFREGRPAGAVGDPANCQQLQMEVEALQHEVARLVDKCERQQRRYDERRERTREKLQKARDAAYSEKGSLQSEVLSMQSEIALLRATLEKDSDWEEHLHDDHQRALLEKRDLLTQLADQEEAMRDNTRKMAMLQLHCKFMEDQNSALQLRLHAYITRQSNSRLPDRVITDSYRPGLVQTLTQDVDSTSTHTPDPQLLRHRARMDSGDDDVSYADVVSRGEDHFPLAAAKDEIIDM